MKIENSVSADAVRAALLSGEPVIMGTSQRAREMWNASRGRTYDLQNADDRNAFDAMTDDELDQQIQQHERLIENIQSTAANAGRELNRHEQSRLGEAQESLAILQAEDDARRTPRARRSEPNGLQPGETQNANYLANETRAQQAGQRQRQPRASVPAMPAQPRSAAHAMGGFRSSAEFLQAVMAASAKGGTTDPRLIANTGPTTYGTEGTGADGGFAVPPDFRANIISKVMGETSLLARTDQMTTSSNAITIPADETTPWQSTGGIQAYWESEAGQFTQSKPALKGLTVKTSKLIALVPLTDELLEDAQAMAAYVNRKAPEKIDFKINEAIIKGTGVGQPLGILNSAGTITVAAESGQVADTVVFDNVNNMWNRLPAASRATACWLANADIESQLMKMTFPGATGFPVPAYLPPFGLSATPFGTLLGRPVMTSEAMPALGDAGDLVLCDMKQYLSVVKTGGMRQDVSIHLWFDYDVIAFRFILRIGGQPYWNSEIARSGAQSSRAFFIRLGAR